MGPQKNKKIPSRPDGQNGMSVPKNYFNNSIRFVSEKVRPSFN